MYLTMTMLSEKIHTFPGHKSRRDVFDGVRIHRQNDKGNTVAAVNPIGLGCDQYQVFHDVSAAFGPYWLGRTPHSIIY